jgi:hypothetical protein
MDPQLGDKPLGVPTVQRDEEGGVYTETLLDHARTVQDEIVPRLRSGSLAGMSFRFEVIDEEWNDDRTERTIKELKLYEYGPVTWPAYKATTVGIRSLADYNEFKKEAARTLTTEGITPDAEPEPDEGEAASTSLPEHVTRDLNEWKERKCYERAH